MNRLEAIDRAAQRASYEIMRIVPNQDMRASVKALIVKAITEQCQALLEAAADERRRIAAAYETASANNTCEVGGHVNRQWAHLEGAVMVVTELRRSLGHQLTPGGLDDTA